MTTTTEPVEDGIVAMEEPVDAAAILRNARALVPWLTGQRERIEAARRLPDDVVARLRAAGCFRLHMPRAWDGPECTPAEACEIIEAVSLGDTSAGWCVMIGCDAGLYSAWLDDDVARALYPDLDVVQAGWVLPVGTANHVEGGYRVSGDFMFGSGCQHSDVLAGGCVTDGDGSGGPPEWRIMLAPRDQWEILDTWYTTGLAGTGSTDYRCRDLFVPAEHTFSFLEPAKRSGTLYGAMGSLLGKAPGVALGLARAAINAATATLETKVDRLTGTPYRSMSRVQDGIGRVECMTNGARAYVYDALAVQWARLEAGEPLTKKERADVWLSRMHASQAARDVARALYDLVGASSIYRRRAPFDRFLRDSETMCQHLVAQEKGYELVGAMLLDPDGASAHPML
jgi:alkylation response protein AidB-like acyl-CoA dehydrogenase